MGLFLSTNLRMMVVVALAAALTSGPAYLERRAIRFERISQAIQRRLDEVPFSELDLYMISTSTNCDPESTPAEKKEFLDSERRRMAEIKPLMTFHDYYQRLTQKYQYAASHPWLPIAPDPPPPPTPSIEYRRSIRANRDRILSEVDSKVR